MDAVRIASHRLAKEVHSIKGPKRAKLNDFNLVIETRNLKLMNFPPVNALFPFMHYNT
jgi:hypothetical protein